MNLSLSKYLIPLLAAGLGVACSLLVASGFRHTDSQLQAAVSRFNELDPATQEQLHNNAGGFLARTPEDQARLQAIHEAVQQQPELETRLKSLQEWWLTLTPAERGHFVDSDGHFDANWVQTVEAEYSNPTLRAQQVTIIFPLRSQFSSVSGANTRYEFSLDQFQLLLDEVIPDPVPKELQQKLAGFSKENETLERMLVRTIWLAQQLASQIGLPQSPPPGESGRTVVKPETVRKAIDDFLLDSPSRERLNAVFNETSDTRLLDRLRMSAGQAPGGNPADRRPQDWLEKSKVFFVTSVFIRGTLEHLYTSLRRTRSSDPGVDLVTLFETGLDREQQLNLMGKDPADASHSLRILMFEKLNAENPAMAGLLNDIRAISNNGVLRGGFDFRRFDPRGGRGGYGGPGQGRVREDSRTGPPRGNGPPQGNNGEPNEFRDPPRGNERRPDEPNRTPPPQ